MLYSLYSYFTVVSLHFAYLKITVVSKILKFVSLLFPPVKVMITSTDVVAAIENIKHSPSFGYRFIWAIHNQKCDTVFLFCMPYQPFF